MSDIAAWDINKWLADALQPLNLSASEEPMRKKQDASAYITWQQPSVTNKAASGETYAQSARVTLWLWALGGSDWQKLRQDIINALLGAGAKSARAGPENWLADIERRQATVYVLLRRDV